VSSLIELLLGILVCCSPSTISDFKVFKVTKEIGSGGYGQVLEVKRETMDKQSYALKIIKLLDR